MTWLGAVRLGNNANPAVDLPSTHLWSTSLERHFAGQKSETGLLWVCTVCSRAGYSWVSIRHLVAVPSLYRYGRLLLLVSNHRSPVPIPGAGQLIDAMFYSYRSPPLRRY